MTPIFVHIHLFKNAGTSVDLALEEFFGVRWCNSDSGRPSGRVTGRDVATLLAERPELDAISSHQVRPPIDSFLHRPVHYLGFVRHPVDRIKSIYDFDRKRGPVTPMGELAAALGFADYVDRLIADDNQTTADFQVRNFSTRRGLQTGRHLGHSMERHLQSALAFVQQPNVTIGRVDRFSEGAAAMEAAIAAHHPGFRFVVQHANRTQASEATLEDRLVNLREEVGDSRYAMLLDRNRLDLELFAAVVPSH